MTGAQGKDQPRPRLNNTLDLSYLEYQQITRYALSFSGTHTLDVTEFSAPTGLVHEYVQVA